jgi:hypothetical protein
VPDAFGCGFIEPLVKDKPRNLSSSDNYRGITISPLISNILELCFLSKFTAVFHSCDLQFGFKQSVGCGPVIFLAEQVIKCFNLHDSSVGVSAVDASKALDRINHSILFQKLKECNVPWCFIGIVICWYNKLFHVYDGIMYIVAFSRFPVASDREGYCHLFCSTFILMISFIS